MKSKTKNANKAHLLLAFGKGIAASRAIEAAMLFSQCGFDIHTVFLEGAYGWVSHEALRDITQHSIAGCCDLPDSPKWFAPTWKGYDLAVVFSPSKKELHEILGFIPAESSSTEHICGSSKNIIIACDGDLTDDLPCFEEKPEKHAKVFVYPKNLCRLGILFNEIFSYSAGLLSSKVKQHLNCYYSSEINTENLNNVKSSLESKGINQCNAKEEADILVSFENEDNFLIKIKNNQEIQCKKIKNGILLKFQNGTERLFPDITGRSSYRRLAEFIITESSRIQKQSEIDQ